MAVCLDRVCRSRPSLCFGFYGFETGSYSEALAGLALTGVACPCLPSAKTKGVYHLSHIELFCLTLLSQLPEWWEESDR